MLPIILWRMIFQQLSEEAKNQPVSEFTKGVIVNANAIFNRVFPMVGLIALIIIVIHVVMTYAK